MQITLIGVAIIALQLAFSRRWLSTHKQGPMERLWKRLTWWLPLSPRPASVARD